MSIKMIILMKIIMQILNIIILLTKHQKKLNIKKIIKILTMKKIILAIINLQILVKYPIIIQKIQSKMYLKIKIRYI